MSHKTYLGALLGLGLLCIGTGALWAEDNDGLIIKIKPQFANALNTVSSLKQLNQECQVKEIVPIDQANGVYQLRLCKEQNIDSAMAKYQIRPELDYVEINRALDPEPMHPVVGTPLSTQSLETNSIVKVSNAPEAKQRITVAVVDSGVDYTHPLLKNGLWVNPGEDLNHSGKIDPEEINSSDDDGDGYVDDFYGANVCSLTGSSGNPMDEYGHGTHVAGIVLQNALNKSGENTAEIMAVRFLNANGSGYLADGVKAIDYAIKHGAKIINCSWGYSYSSSSLSNVMQKAEDQGVQVVCAAGNYNSETPLYPAYVAHAIAVAALDKSGHKASFSNYGADVDLAAEGVSIYSSYLNNQYATLSGTSMASPKVAGILALAWASKPELSASALWQAVQASAVDITDPLHDGSSYVGKDKYTGYGTLSVDSLLSELGTSSPVAVASTTTTTLSNLMNYPNPITAGAATTFGFQSDNSVDVTVRVYTLRGKLVRQFNTSKSPVSSYIKVSYDCTDDSGRRLPMDVYLYQVQALDSAGILASGIGKMVVLN